MYPSPFVMYCTVIIMTMQYVLTKLFLVDESQVICCVHTAEKTQGGVCYYIFMVTFSFFASLESILVVVCHR